MRLLLALLLLSSLLPGSAQVHRRHAIVAALPCASAPVVFNSATVWLDASVASSVFQENTFSTPAANGTAFGGWRDISSGVGGGTNHFTQGGNRVPVYIANWQNGKAAAFFDDGDGGADVLRTATTNTFGLTSATGFTMLVVAQWNQDVFVYDALFSLNVGTNSNVYNIMQRNNNALTWLVGSSIANGVISTAGTTNGQKFVMIGRYDNTQPIVKLRSTFDAERTATITAGGMGRRGIGSIGGIIFYDGTYNTDNFLQGYIAEVVLWPYYLSDSETLTAFSYETNKYNLP